MASTAFAMIAWSEISESTGVVTHGVALYPDRIEITRLTFQVYQSAHDGIWSLDQIRSRFQQVIHKPAVGK